MFFWAMAMHRFAAPLEAEANKVAAAASTVQKGAGAHPPSGFAADLTCLDI